MSFHNHGYQTVDPLKRSREMLEVVEGRVRIANIPPGALVLDMCHDFQRDAIGLRLYHEDFELVAPGAECKSFLAIFEATYKPVDMGSIELKFETDSIYADNPTIIKEKS